MDVNNKLSIKVLIKFIPLFILFCSCMLTVMTLNSIYKNIGMILFIGTSVLIIVARKIELRRIFNVEFFLIMIYMFTSIFVGYSDTSLLLLIILYFMHILFDNIEYSIDSIINYINYTYLAYVIISIFIYTGTIALNRQFNIFEINVLGENIKTFVGVGGSTSEIDSYSGLVFLYNFLFNKKKHRVLWCVLSFISMVGAFRMTPIVSIIVVLVYNIITINNIKIKKIIFITVSLVAMISFIMPSYLNNVNFADITHARDTVWNMYINIIKGSDVKKIWFGIRTIPETYLPWSSVANYNPHSTYLLWLLYYGLIIYIIYYLYIIKKFYISQNSKYLSIILFIFITNITNGTIMSDNNPIYLIIIYYMLSCIKKIPITFKVNKYKVKN